MPMQNREDARRRMDRLAARLTQRTRLLVLKALTIGILCLAVLPFLGRVAGLWTLDQKALWMVLVILSYGVAARALWDQESDLRFLFDHPELIESWKRRNSDQEGN